MLHVSFISLPATHLGVLSAQHLCQPPYYMRWLQPYSWHGLFHLDINSNVQDHLILVLSEAEHITNFTYLLN